VQTLSETNKMRAVEPIHPNEIVVGLPSRQVLAAKQGVGSFVTIDIGTEHTERSPDGAERRIADLHVWIYLCDWELTKRGTVVLSSASSRAAFSARLADLTRRDLEEITVGSNPGMLILLFSGGYQFTLRENLDEYDTEDDMLVLYPYQDEPIGYRATVGFYRDSAP
jgi:hypothetical protein